MTQIGCSVCSLLHSPLIQEEFFFSSFYSFVFDFGVEWWLPVFISFLSLCQNTRYNQLKGGNIYIVCWLWRFQCVITWPHCLWACARPKSTSCQELMEEESAYLIARLWKRDKNWLGLNICSRVCLPSCLKDSVICLSLYGLGPSLPHLVL
jgi:hypothetical protein